MAHGGYERLPDYDDYDPPGLYDDNDNVDDYNVNYNPNSLLVQPLLQIR